jgi:hypothetical protein
MIALALLAPIVLAQTTKTVSTTESITETSIVTVRCPRLLICKSNPIQTTASSVTGSSYAFPTLGNVSSISSAYYYPNGTGTSHASSSTTTSTSTSMATTIVPFSTTTEAVPITSATGNAAIINVKNQKSVASLAFVGAFLAFLL